MQITTEKEAYQYCEDTKTLYNRLGLGFLELAKRLCLIKANNLAEGQYGGFLLYLDDMKLKQVTATHMMRVYQRFCLDFGISEADVIQAGGYTRLYELLPLAKTKEKALEVLEHAKSLPSRESIKQYVKEAMTGEFDTVDCAHEDTFLLRICKGCGHKEKVFENGEVADTTTN